MIDLCIGRRELGKTTMAYKLSLGYPTRVIFDPRAQFHTTSDILKEPDDLYDLLDARSEIIIQPEFDVPGALEETCAIIREWLLANPGEKLCLLIDEARFSRLDDNEAIPPSLDRIMRLAPREEVAIIITAHRPKDIAVDIRAIADFWMMFRTTQEHDLKVIAERCGQEIADRVGTLKDREVMIWNDAEGRASSQLDPRVWYVSLSEPMAVVRPKEKEQWSALV